MFEVRLLRLRKLPPDLWICLAITAFVLLANSLYLLGFFDPNPLGPLSRLGVVSTSGVLPGRPSIDPANGFVSQALGHRAALDMLHGHLPWWNPYEGTGAPLAGEMQSAVFFPPTLLTVLSNGQLYEHVLLEVVAGISTYFLLRRLGPGRVVCMAGAMWFGLNGTFAWLGNAIVNPVAFLPLLLLGIELAYAATKQGRHGGWWLIAIAVALSVYAGFPEVAYLDGLLCVGWFVWRCVGSDVRFARQFVFKATAGVLVGVALCAPLLVAFGDYLGQADVGGHAHGAFAGLHLRTSTFAQTFMPYVFGPVSAFSGPKAVLSLMWRNSGGYLSTSVVFFGALGLFGRQHRGLRILLAAWVAVLLARMYGTPGFVATAVNHLPRFSDIAVHRYSAPSIEMAAVVLAALGLHDAVGKAASRRMLVAVLAGSLAFCAALTVSARSFGTPAGWHPYLVGAVSWAMAIVAIGGIAAFVRAPRLRAGLAAGVVVADALAFYVVPQLSAPRSVRLNTAAISYLQRHLATDRFFTLGPLQPNYGSYFGTAELNVNDVPVPAAFSHYVTHHLDPFVDPTVFDGTSAARGAKTPAPATQLALYEKGYKDAGVAYVLVPPHRVRFERGINLSLVLQASAAWIYRLGDAAHYMTLTDPHCTVRILTRTTADVDCTRATQLIRRETNLDGWRATIDAHATPIRPTDDIFQTVLVPAGAHLVRFSYAPPYIGWGWLGLGLGTAGLLTPVIRRRLIARHTRQNLTIRV